MGAGVSPAHLRRGRAILLPEVPVRKVLAVLALGACGGSSGDGTTDDRRGLAELFADLFDGKLTEEEFVDEFAERYCAEWEDCNTSGAPCGVDEDAETAVGPCEFDEDAAEECLDGTWTCNTDFPGLEYVVPPPECMEVLARCSS